MRSKLLTVGDEILIGQIINTNASYIGGKLFSIGLPLEKIVSIGDNEKSLLEEFEDSFNRYDVTIITGGLGPTHDDITKPALVKFFKDELVMDRKVLDHVKLFFNSRKIPMPVSNEAQALIPKNSSVIWNDNGTAPGLWIEKDNKVFIAVPGVPYEMRAMFENKILVELQKKFSRSIDKVYMQKTLLTTGLGESTLHERIGDINVIIGDGKLAFLPSEAGVRLRINVEGKSNEDALKKLNQIEQRLQSKIGSFVYGKDNESLEQIITNILRGRKKTLSVAESCTGGRISSRLVRIPGCSEYYMGGVCAYSNKEKIKILNVKEETLRNHGAVSEQTAIEMAEGVRGLMQTDYAISTSGIMGPTGGSDLKPVGLVWIGFSSKEKSYAKDFLFGNIREVNIERGAQRALEILRRELLNIENKF